MKICEEFKSLQGEGKYIGVPSYFVRTTGCNLRCSWKNEDGSITICDTPYTSFNPEKGKDVDGEYIHNQIKNKPIQHIVITGGEPTLQNDLANVVEYLNEKGYVITIETNGTRYVKLPKEIFMSISPKLLNSYNQTKGSNEEALHRSNNNFEETVKLYITNNEYQLKFVYNNKHDIHEIDMLQNKLIIPNNKIYLMPQGITVEQFKEKQRELFQFCVKKGWNYTPRMHIDIYGNHRGI